MRRAFSTVLPVLTAVFAAAFFIGTAAVNSPPTNSQPHDPPGEPSAPALAPSSNCEDGEQDSGAVYRMCMPTTTPWNGDLMIYAHGYAAPDKPVGIPENQMSLPGSDTMVDEIVNSLGFAFATTSYYTNGLAVLPALANLLDLVDVFSRTQEAPHRIYLAGVSEGGLITTLALEQYPDVYDGGLAMCGPYGSFEVQTNHLGDAPVIFDYFFPGLMPGTAVDIPESLMEQWEAGFYSTTIRPVGQCLTMRPTSIRSTNC